VLRHAAAAADAVIHLAQASTAREDLAAALAMMDGVGSGLYVHTGGTWVYGDTNGIVDETAPWNPPPVVAWRKQVEDAVLERGQHAVIVQPGLVYGGENRLIDYFFTQPGRETGRRSVHRRRQQTTGRSITSTTSPRCTRPRWTPGPALSTSVWAESGRPRGRSRKSLGAGSTTSITLEQARERWARSPTRSRSTSGSARPARVTTSAGNPCTTIRWRSSPAGDRHAT
jgi:hypothetical protein